MDARRGKLSMCTAVASALAIAGCGSSSSNGDRTKLIGQLSSQLQASTVPSDLAACVTQQAKGLSTPDLRSLAKAGSSPPPATKQLGAHLVASCISQGKGVSVLHNLLVASIERQSGPTLPPVFTSCLVGKANATTPVQLSALISAYANQNATAAQAQARQLGAGLAGQCLDSPSVVDALRTAFVTPIKNGFRTTHYSAAFQSCVLAKAQSIPAAQLKQMIADPAGAGVAGQAFGRQAAQACVAQGAKP